ncbi:MAG: hypothetical protein CALGDGBN_03189 [Pseudomonadales bacterium]|nr:hypothetical protein [Pseudomonadales bacterium]
MSGKPSTTAIGAFVVGAIVLSLGAAIFFGGQLFGSRLGQFGAAVIFTGSVKGLDVGAPVTLRGVKVGEVTDLHVSYDAARQQFVIPVTIALDRGELGLAPDVTEVTSLRELIDRGLRAQLKTQSLLTGLLYVDLDFLPQSPARYVEFATEEPQIPTAPTELEAILQRVSEIDLQSFMQNADQTLRALSELLSSEEMQRIPANVNATLAEVRTLVASTGRELNALGARLDTLSSAADGTLGELRTQLQRTGDGLDASLRTLDATLASVRGASEQAGHTLSEDSAVFHELRRTAADLGRAARALQAMADTLAREPEAVLRGRSDRSEDR